MWMKQQFLKDVNGRVDYGPALLFCDTYFAEQFEYGVKLTLLYLHVAGHSCCLISRMFIDMNNQVSVHFKVFVVKLATCSLLLGCPAARFLIHGLAVLKRWQNGFGESEGEGAA